MQIHHLKASRYSINSSSPVGGNRYSDIYSPLKKNLGRVLNKAQASRYSINSSSWVGGNGYLDIYSPLKKNLGGALNKALVLNEVDRSAYLGHVGSSRSEDEEVWR